ncbi:MAG: hypothetical protein JWN40_3671 [Phycisphaerales bacterium]|nr:hypothetical protein [Phycisphaerales bacterium]
MFHSTRATVPLFLLASMLALSAQADSPYAPFKNGPPQSDDYFPIAVWLQSPAKAAQYQAIGINTYVGIWRSPTVEQLAELQKHDISLICHYKPEFKDQKTIIGWMHGDEPDNAQSLPGGKGYGPPITPEKIVADYQKLKEADPTRPILLNLGQGVAYDNYIGRGVRRRKLEDYPKYIQGSDIVSFDIYPATHDEPEIAGHLEYVPKGVTRLREWSDDKKIVWNCIETTRISNEKLKPTPQQVKAEVWMSLIHGSRGLIYFAHEFKPKFIEAGLLADKEMAKAVGQINAQIKELAPALNAAADPTAVTVATSNKEVPIAFTARRHAGNLYLFAVAMRNEETQATFTITNPKPPEKIEVLSESRLIPAATHFEDTFKGYEVHLYRIR